MYTADQIRAIHFEVTTHCNARCPQCPRNIDGGARNPNLPLTQLYLEDAQRIFPAAEFPRLERVQVCGNYGDAVMARDFLEIAAHIKSLYPACTITLATNGALRPADWWRALATHVDYCVFGIDGLADTHALYRIGTDFETVIANARSFMEGGGRAEWAYLIFKHNQHQVEAAHRLSRELGFETFSAKATSRFYCDGRKAAATPVRDETGRVIYALEASDDTRLANVELERLDAMLLDDPAKFRDYITSTPIDCKAITRGKLYVSGEGHVFPCCWLGNLYDREVPWQETEIGRAIETSGGLDVLDARRSGIAGVLQSNFFTKAVPRGWEPGAGRLRTCSKMCGAIDINLAQYVDYVPDEECV